MKLAAFFLCILFFASCKNQLDSDHMVDVNMPEIENTVTSVSAQIGFENRKIELGKIVSFNNNHIIYFTNEGDTTLILNDVFTESDRVEVFGFTYEITPGAQGKIRLKIDPKLDHQSYSDYLFIRTNSNNTSSLNRLELHYELSNDLVIGGLFVDVLDRINVRMFPSLDATVLFGLEKGDYVKCIGSMRKDYVQDFDSDLWYYIDYNGRKGWVLSALTEFEEKKV